MGLEGKVAVVDRRLTWDWPGYRDTVGRAWC